MRARPPRLIDVAEAAGVSIATASRAMAGTGGVSDRVAERVRAIGASLGYVTNPHARSLAAGVSLSVGLMVREIRDPYFAEIAGGVVRAAAETGRSVQICHTGSDPDEELRQLRTLIANRVGAILLAGSGYVDPEREAPAREELERYVAAGGRVAVIGRHQLGVDAVLPDNTGAGRAIGAHLASLGHRRVAVASGPRELTTVADRLAGVADALDGAAVTVYEDAFTREGGRRCVERILAERPDTTAVVALNDDMAIGCLSALRTAGVAVPGRIAVTGFDDIAVAADLSPGLTTVRLPMSELGARALALTQQPPAARPRRVRLGTTLVVRDSTAPARP